MGNSGSNCFIVIASGRTSISCGAGALRAENGSNNFKIREKVLKENCVLCLTSLNILGVKEIYRLCRLLCYKSYNIQVLHVFTSYNTLIYVSIYCYDSLQCSYTVICLVM